MEFAELREAIEKIQLVDGHAHNIVALDSTFPFVNSFSEAHGDALSDAPHSLSFKVLAIVRLTLLIIDCRFAICL